MSGQLKGIMDNRNKKDVNIDEIDVLPEPEQDPETLPDEEIEDEPSDEDIEPMEDIEDDEEDIVPVEKKLTDVSREASVLHFKNKKLVDTIEEASRMPEPTLDELKVFAKSRGADYDELDEFSQNILKDTLINQRKLTRIESVTDETKAYDAWAGKVNDFIESSLDSGKYPTLATLQREFKRFAMKESRVGLDLDDLVASFLYSAEKVVPKNKRSLLLSGGNSSAVPPKPKGYTEEQVARIREKEPKLYRQLIKAGKINLEI